MKSAFRIVLALAILFLLTGPSYAGGPATQSVRKTNRAIRLLLDQNVTPGSKQERERHAKLTKELALLLDAEELARLTLKDHIDTLSAAERKEFQTLLSALVAKSYTEALQEQPNYHIKYIQEKSPVKSKGGARIVVTELHTKQRGRPQVVKMEYWLHKKRGRWRVFDVVTDGASLADNYRALFNGIIAGEAGYPGLLVRMQERQAKPR